ncbi:hypothetical protein F5I97DRAFT_1863980 [Phlebopus sp. FC_14]|nr:hypothetical protein F5I97DRAFT_1863980 [Phlebopus sp. FC_14]
MSSAASRGVSDAPSLFSFVLEPGSSLHPTFLLAVDCAFTVLFLVFVCSAYLTKGNVHFFVLMGIELALWASVKWFVQELGKLPPASKVMTQKKEL